VSGYYPSIYSLPEAPLCKRKQTAPKEIIQQHLAMDMKLFQTLCSCKCSNEEFEEKRVKVVYLPSTEKYGSSDPSSSKTNSHQDRQQGERRKTPPWPLPKV
jgi:hypothetical protein